MAISIASMLTKLIPSAVFSAIFTGIERANNTVSNRMLVNKPLIMAKLITNRLCVSGAQNWNARIVPKSPITHPIRHHKVLYAERFQVDLHPQ